MQVQWLEPTDTSLTFPDASQALSEPNGLLAVGGDLSSARLLSAYRRGIFPWYEDGQPILWWSPDPRSVLFPQALKVSRSLRKSLRNRGWRFSLDTNFRSVMQACAAPRRYSDGTWITAQMIDGYCGLHTLGHAHSAEIWHGDELVGGLYGIAVGRIFCGESMFSRETDASKAALVLLTRHLEHWGFKLIDCQLNSPHLQRLGAEEMARDDYLGALDRWGEDGHSPGAWQVEQAVTKRMAIQD